MYTFSLLVLYVKSYHSPPLARRRRHWKKTESRRGSTYYKTWRGSSYFGRFIYRTLMRMGGIFKTGQNRLFADTWKPPEPVYGVRATLIRNAVRHLGWESIGLKSLLYNPCITSSSRDLNFSVLRTLNIVFVMEITRVKGQIFDNYPI